MRPPQGGGGSGGSSLRASARASSRASPSATSISSAQSEPMSRQVPRPSSTGSIAAKVPPALVNKLGIAIGKRTYKTSREILTSARWLRAYNVGARPQRLLWASTGTKDPKASDILYVKGLASPFTVNTMPENTLLAFGDHGEVGGILPVDGGDCDLVLAEFTKAGIDLGALANQLQEEGAKSFVKSWNELMSVIASKSDTLKKAV